MVTVIGCLLAVRGKEPVIPPVDRTIYLVDSDRNLLVDCDGNYLTYEESRIRQMCSKA